MDKTKELTVETFIPVGISPRMIGQVITIIEQVRDVSNPDKLLAQKCHTVGKLVAYQAKGNRFMVSLDGVSKPFLFNCDLVYVEVLRGIDA